MLRNRRKGFYTQLVRSGERKQIPFLIFTGISIEISYSLTLLKTSFQSFPSVLAYTTYKRNRRLRSGGIFHPTRLSKGSTYFIFQCITQIKVPSKYIACAFKCSLVPCVRKGLHRIIAFTSFYITGITRILQQVSFNIQRTYKVWSKQSTSSAAWWNFTVNCCLSSVTNFFGILNNKMEC